EKSGFRVHPPPDVSFERRSSRLPVRSKSFVRLRQHGGGPASIASFPGDIATEEPRVGGARIRLDNIRKVLVRLRSVALRKCHLAKQDQSASLLGVELQPRVECLAGSRK